MGEIRAERAALQRENQNVVVLKGMTSFLSWESLVGQGGVSQQVPVPGYSAQDNFCLISGSCELIHPAKKKGLET